MNPRTSRWLAALLCTLASPALAAPLPPDSGILNVRAFGARGDGVHNDTAALLRAIDAAGKDTGARFWMNRPVYLPNGTYLVSRTLVRRYADGRFASGMLLIGQSEKGTIIKLANHASGFGDAGDPRPVVMTASKLLDRSPNKDYRGKGEGNDAYDNFIEDLTIEVGRGDPGAIGLDYLANNRGAVRNVTVTAHGNDGAVGVSMRRKWPGPALLQHVTVNGFATGIAISRTEYGITLDHVTLRGQRRAGLVDDNNAVSAADLVITDAPVPIVNRSAKGLIVLDGGRMDGKLDSIKGDGPVTLLGFRVSGAAHWGVWQHGKFTAHAAAAFPAALKEAPAVPRDPLTKWANVLAFRAPGSNGKDITEALRRAMASGAATIYIPYGAWTIRGQIAIPPSVRRIVGIESSITVAPARVPTFTRTEGEFLIAAPGPPLEIDGLTFDQTNLGNQVAVTLAAKRTLILRDIVTAGDSLLDRRTTGGPVFIEDTCCGPVGTFHGSAPVYARQLDTEWGAPRIADDGAPIHVLGIKTEGPGTVARVSDGGALSVIGGLLYTVRPNPPALPAFDVGGGSRLSAAFLEESFAPQRRYTVYVAGPRTIAASGFDPRGFGRVVPWLSVAPR